MIEMKTHKSCANIYSIEKMILYIEDRLYTDFGVGVFTEVSSGDWGDGSSRRSRSCFSRGTGFDS